MKKTLVALAIALGSTTAFADKQAVTVVLNAQSPMTQGMAMVLANQMQEQGAQVEHPAVRPRRRPRAQGRGRRSAQAEQRDAGAAARWRDEEGRHRFGVRALPAQQRQEARGPEGRHQARQAGGHGRCAAGAEPQGHRLLNDRPFDRNFVALREARPLECGDVLRRIRSPAPRRAACFHPVASTPPPTRAPRRRPKHARRQGAAARMGARAARPAGRGACACTVPSVRVNPRRHESPCRRRIAGRGRRTPRRRGLP